MKELWRNRVFLIVFSSDVLENIGIWIRNMALLFFVMEVSGNNPIAVSLLTAIELVPILFFSIIGGALADRWNPKRTMISANLLSAVSVIVIATIIWGGSWKAVFFATFISAIVSQFSQPASAKMFKQHVPPDQVGAAISLSQSVNSLFILFGPIVGTVFYQSFGVYLSLFAMAALFLISALMLLGLPSRQIAEALTQARGTLMAQIKDGFSYIRKYDHLRGILWMFVMLGLGSGLINPLEVFIVTDRLQLSKEAIQWFTALEGVGMLLGGILASALHGQLNGKRVIHSAFFFFAASVVIEALSTSVLLTAAMRLFTGVGLAFLEILLGMKMINLVTEEYIGRVNGTIAPFFVGTMMISSFAAGPLMQATSLIAVFSVAGLLILLGSLWVGSIMDAVTVPSTKEAEREENLLAKQ
ncbi:MFS transporter [Brevibacillus ruminantium]|uniref:MFS transporter n=1 Tax=Brevibacillus ruminantium TaxID=2950604 RepID=A0ABY4W9B8_9BACL|nr:MFS transporter [Brevibacillus ruminantium]USG63763.1 MFS transporter [Brevibacillus ruminantium]